MIPKNEDESQVLYDLESKFNAREPYPNDGRNNTESKMIEALNYMKQMDELQISIAHHPSRSATGVGVWGQDTPQEFRNWNDKAPEISIGMEGAPGHQAGAINPDGSIDPNGSRGAYSNANAPTMGGFDQMSAIVGGLWDSMLGEGRHWWITATSDSHVNWRDGGSDFWPGEYSKTYVKAEKNYEDVMENLRNGNVFVTTGDLISELDVKVQAGGKSPLHAEAKGNSASIGETLTLPSKKSDVTVTVRIKDPNAANSNGDKPNVQRVDFIMGEVTGKVEDRSTASNPTTKVVKRFTESDWKKDGEYITISYTLKDVDKDSYATLALILLLGTMFYEGVEGWSLLDSFYFAFISLIPTSVSTGLIPQSELSKWFTMIYLVVGMGVMLMVLIRVGLAVADFERLEEKRGNNK